MATADKLTTVAENVPKVYHAGQLNVVENAECLKGRKTDTAILLDDISPVIHEMGVKISSDTAEDLTAVKVSRCGKNLFDINQINSTTTLINNGDGTLTAKMGASYSYTLLKTICPNLKVGKTYTLNFTTTGMRYIYLQGYNKVWNLGTSLTITETMLNSKVIFYSNKLDGVYYDALISDIQIELGSTATDYKPYISPIEYIPNADGTVEGVTSLYPNTTLMTDTEGVIIDCDYYKDVDKAFDELTQAMTDNL